MGRARKYPIQDLVVGESVFIPWEPLGQKLTYRDRNRICAAIRQEERRSGKRFERRSKASGLRVRRVS